MKAVLKRAWNHTKFLMRIAWPGARVWAMKNYGVDIGGPPTILKDGGSKDEDRSDTDAG